MNWDERVRFVKKLVPSTPGEWQKVLQWMGVSIGAPTLLAAALCIVPYVRAAKQVNKRLRAGLFQNAISYYAAPETLSVGDPVNPQGLGDTLKRAGLDYAVHRDVFTVVSGRPIAIKLKGGSISSIMDTSGHTSLNEFHLPAQFMKNLAADSRAQRMLVHYSDLPPVLVHAILSAEDKRFFEHSGFDVRRIAKAFYVDLREGRKEQGASTITMQLARSLWLDGSKRWSRKLSEALLTMQLEHKLTKQEILEDYCNTVYLGTRGTFSINGIAQAAQAFFNEDVQKLDLAQAATLAGMIQRPNYYNPLRFPKRVVERRNLVLRQMSENNFISAAEYKEASSAPLALHPGVDELSGAQYFIDLAGDEAFPEIEKRGPSGSLKAYTTIDLRLQRAAEDALAKGVDGVMKMLAGRVSAGEIRKHGLQAALVVIDPHTGAVKALCGGRSYTDTQFNRALAKRPPGSVFKPFVYAAALNDAQSGRGPLFTEVSVLQDTPTVFQFVNQTYAPNNFGGVFMGPVTLRYALAHSLNNATVKLGSMVGFDRIASLAHRSGLNEDIQGTPSVALGAYQVTPLAMAGAYTVFANGGVWVRPGFTNEIRDHNGVVIYQRKPETRAVLDPRVAFLMVDMLQNVMRTGTAAGARSLGFLLPAAGKTGTSHDGWFAGFTSQLLCIVWVGFDDYTDLGLEGARSALPIWTSFMMEAARYSQYRDAKPFAPPPGVVQVAIDGDTGLVATQDCSDRAVPVYFLAGTQPLAQCQPQAMEFGGPSGDQTAMSGVLPVVRNPFPH